MRRSFFDEELDAEIDRIIDAAENNNYTIEDMLRAIGRLSLVETADELAALTLDAIRKRDTPS